MNEVHTLVIACGNPLRGDDAVGPRAADIVKSWDAPGVKVLVVHQLVPELIGEMKQVERVLFIDAGTNAGEGAFQSRIVEPKKSSRLLGHHETPANLLAMLRDLEGRVPQAWLVTISAVSFHHGAEVTEEARNRLQRALAWIGAFLGTERSCMKSV